MIFAIIHGLYICYKEGHELQKFGMMLNCASSVACVSWALDDISPNEEKNLSRQKGILLFSFLETLHSSPLYLYKECQIIQPCETIARLFLLTFVGRYSISSFLCKDISNHTLMDVYK